MDNKSKRPGWYKVVPIASLFDNGVGGVSERKYPSAGRGRILQVVYCQILLWFTVRKGTVEQEDKIKLLRFSISENCSTTSKLPRLQMMQQLHKIMEPHVFIRMSATMLVHKHLQFPRQTRPVFAGCGQMRKLLCHLSLPSR